MLIGKDFSNDNYLKQQEVLAEHIYDSCYIYCFSWKV
jgi:hypothetical protein